MFNRSNNTTQQISLDVAGQPFETISYLNSISQDGRYVVFTNVNGSNIDAYLRDTVEQTTELLSLTFNELPLRYVSQYALTATPNARYIITWATTGDGIEGGEDDDLLYVFVHDRDTSTTTRVSVSSTAELPNGDSMFDQWQPVSDDGRYVVFASMGTNLATPDNNGSGEDVFLHDRSNGTTTRINQDTNGENNDIRAYAPVISGNGQYVAYFSYEDSSQTTPTEYVKNLNTGVVTRYGLGAGEIDYGTGPELAFTDDGRFLFFRSNTVDLVPNDTNGTGSDYFRVDQVTGQIEIVSLGGNDQQAAVDGSLSISGNGRILVFASTDPIVDEDTNGAPDIYIRDLGLSEWQVAQGETVTTDEPVSDIEPLQTSVTAPDSGEVIVHEGDPTLTLEGQYSLLGQQAQITSPVGTVSDPIRLVFRLDSTALGETAPEDVIVFRNGVAVEDCTGAPNEAIPNPCVSSRVAEADGDVTVTILTIAASTWNFAKQLYPVDKADCKLSEWDKYNLFRNQGQCMDYVNQLAFSTKTQL